MQSKTGKRILTQLIFILPITSIVFSSPRVQVSVKLFHSLNINKIEIESPQEPGYRIKIEDGSIFDLNAGMAVRIEKQDKGILVTLGSRSLKTAKIGFSQKKEGESYILIATDKTDRRLYSGNINIDLSDNCINVIDICGIEEYVDQLLLAEFSSIDNQEALKAVSVVIRTYLYYHLGRHKTGGFDFCDTTHCQAFKGWNNPSIPYVKSVRSKLDKILSPSRNMLLSYNGRIIEGYYSACCGGKLASPGIIWNGKSDFPYRNAKSPFCSASKFYRWHREMSKKDFSSVFGLADKSLKIEIHRNDEDNDFVNTIMISDSDHRYEMNVVDFRRKIADKAGWNKILSHSFWIEQTEDKIIFKGNGFGHSIGLCEACAYEMGMRGYSWKNILDFFFYQADLMPADSVKYLSVVD